MMLRLGERDYRQIRCESLFSLVVVCLFVIVMETLFCYVLFVVLLMQINALNWSFADCANKPKVLQTFCKISQTFFIEEE